jgi:hypothetical protein
MFAKNSKEFPKIIDNPAKTPRAIAEAFSVRKGRLYGMHPIDCRSKGWKALKKCIDKNGSNGTVALFARWRDRGVYGPFCNDCITSLHRSIYALLDARFGYGLPDGPLDIFLKYSPAADVISYVGQFLMNPENSEAYLKDCKLEHALKDGDYVTTIHYEFKDVSVEVDYYVSVTKQ